MSTPDLLFPPRLRRAYETGRLRVAALWSLPLLPLIALACTCCASPAHVLLLGGALVGTVIALRWRGEEYAVGVTPGLVAGLGPMLVPVAGRIGGTLCGIEGCAVTPTVCALGGLLGGVLLGFLAPPPGVGRTVPFVVACLVAALTGAVGCLMYGLVGLAVMVGGLAVGALPLLAARRA